MQTPPRKNRRIEKDHPARTAYAVAGTRTRDLHGHNVALYQLSYYSQQKKVLGFYYMQQVPEHSQKLVIGNVKNRKLKAMGAKHKRHFWSTPKALQKEEKMQKRPFH